MVNVNGELENNGDRWIMEKTRSGPHTITKWWKMNNGEGRSLPHIVTLPPSKSHTTGVTLESLCYGNGSLHFIFSVLPNRLYTLFSFLFRWLCYDSFPGLNQRSRQPDLDLRYDFLFWQTILFPHVSLYDMVISTFPSIANNRCLPSLFSYYPLA